MDIETIQSNSQKNTIDQKNPQKRDNPSPATSQPSRTGEKP
jgi:hypothetical protein